MSEFLMESKNIKQAFVPVDMNAGANTGARIKIDSGDRISYVLSMGDSTAAAVVLTVNQHNAASGGTSKVLAIANPYFSKKGAETSFTKVVPTSASETIDVSARFANDEGVVIVEVLGENVDVDSGFAWISVDCADATAAKIGAAIYMVSDLRYKPGYSQDL